MKNPQTVLAAFLLCLLFPALMKSTHAYTLVHGDYFDKTVWSPAPNGVLPDTLFVRHYLTASGDILLKTKTVLIIEKNGTLCGNVKIEMECGAKFINYGNLYFNTASVNNMENFGSVFYETGLHLNNCSGVGYSNQSPGTTGSWNGSFCKTAETGWSPALNTGIHQRTASQQISVSPNPIQFGKLLVSGGEQISINLYDQCGRLLFASEGNGSVLVDMEQYPSGIYLLLVKSGEYSVQRKVLKQ